MKPISKGSHRNHRLEVTWDSIKARCYNPNNHAYKDYGGRGIKIAQEWLTASKPFVDDILQWLGPPPAGASLDRIDNDRGYEILNLRWATKREQAMNRRRRSDNVSGRVGLYWCAPLATWKVKKTIDGVTYQRYSKDRATVDAYLTELELAHGLSSTALPS